MSETPPPVEPPPPPPPEPTRRDFLATATTALGACAGAAALAPALVAFLSPLEGGIVKLGEGLLDLGALDAFEEGTPRKVTIRAARTDAYMKEDAARALGSVLVVRRGQTADVFAAQCPHAGCDVSPATVSSGRSTVGALVCPCHESQFGLDGSVKSGPSPRRLDALETTMKDGHVLIRFERFQVGVADKRAL